MKLMTAGVLLILALCLPDVPVLAAAAPGDASANQQAGVDEAQLKSLQSRMQGDPQIMALIRSLQNDPEMKALLSDPAFMQAIASRDINKLTNDPRFVKLFNNQSVQQIIKRVEP